MCPWVLVSTTAPQESSNNKLGSNNKLEKVKKDICEEPRETGRVSYVKILLILLAVLFEVLTKEAASNSNRVHQFTSPDGQGMITMNPQTAYRRSGENLDFLNDCLATQIEAIIQELDFIRVHPPQYIHQKKPQNETIIEKLETRECSDPRPLIPLRNKKELQKGGRNTPKFLDSIKNRKGSKNETIWNEFKKDICVKQGFKFPQSTAVATPLVSDTTSPRSSNKLGAQKVWRKFQFLMTSELKPKD